ncbi:LysE family translocator [Geodermatophilus sp. YIM 151500]|uniref:LysE family translocator n=1 Tax=Geodermatophilus sp. YIM 151500 TaxID=2984531 RepID=UPI0021E40744|nr:LysE family translocator [Geodermatophilus sp. YIM 151500]MCV2491506.1 LysE family translocator [Geodermatophilus sp. YIM 151500]
MSLATAVAGFAVVAAALTVTPGLDTALVLRAALTGRRRDALATAAGIVAGLFVWGTAAAVGVSALLTASRLAHDVLRFAGAAWLLWLGARLLRRAVRGADAEVVGPGRSGGSAWRAVRTGLLTNLLNPKVGVSYVALLPQFVPPGSDPLAVGLLLAGVHGALSVAWFVLITLVASAFAAWLRRPAVARAVDGATGAVLVAFGARLALGR